MKILKLKSIVLFTTIIFWGINCDENTANSNNKPPTCVITSPENFNEIEQGEIVTISVDADDEDGDIKEVRFYIDNVGQYSTTKFPYNYKWDTKNVEIGEHIIKVTVEDDDGEIDIDTRTITVTDTSSNNDSEDNDIEYGTVTDIDGNTYKTVKIGDQWWMAENLRVTTYRNGESVYKVVDGYEWSILKDKNISAAHCANENDEANADIYGYLYNGYAVNDSRNIAPQGWHIPSDKEWEELAKYISDDNGGYSKLEEDWSDVGLHLKSTSGWKYNGNGTDDYGFKGLPAGYRGINNGRFDSPGSKTWFWSTGKGEYAWARTLWSNKNILYREQIHYANGISVRCVSDNYVPGNTPPTASFKVSKSFGTTSTIFTFDASECKDAEDNTPQLQVRWDWEGDGTWDTDWSITKSESHQYNTQGDYKVILEVKDTENVYDSYSKMINVYKNDIKYGEVIDIDGNTYVTVKLGNNWWMAENLKVTKYRNGVKIAKATNYTDWSNLNDNVNGAYCAYDNLESNGKTYGYLYNWYAVNRYITDNDASYNIAPQGWHIPTDEEWKDLEKALGMSDSKTNTTGYRGTNEGSKLAGRADLWIDGELENNIDFRSTGFTGLPAGFCSNDGSGGNMNHFAYFWSVSENDSNEAWCRILYSNSSKINRCVAYMKYGFSIRCVKD